MCIGSEPAAVGVAGAEGSHPAAASRVLTGACVLVVDDRETNVRRLEQILTDAGAASIHAVADARLAVDRCLELGPDLVMVNLHMPHVDDGTVLSALRATAPPGQFLPIVVVTVDSASDVRERALDAGANDFVANPFDRVEVVQRVRNLLSMRSLYHDVQRHDARSVGDSSPQAEERRRELVEADERRRRVDAALAHGALHMVFQPIVDLRSGHIVAVEALARFACEPRRPPDVWFAEAEDAGMGVELELAAIDAALARLDDLPADVVITINASPKSTLSGVLGARLQQVAGARVVLELTEHNRIDDYDAVIAALDGLRRQGVRIAVDDASAGYNGLQQILRLRPDIIKLDREITSGIDGDPVRRALASSLMTFGGETGALVVAEGIETAGELTVLRDLGVRWGQGYHLARPGPLPCPRSVAV